MDKKDEIILQQLEVIRTMTERNLLSLIHISEPTRP